MQSAYLIDSNSENFVNINDGKSVCQKMLPPLSCKGKCLTEK